MLTWDRGATWVSWCLESMRNYWSYGNTVICARLWKRKSLILVSLMAQDLSVCECVFVCLPCSRFECNIQTDVLCFCHICPNTHAHAAGTNQPNASIQPSVVHYHPLPWHSAQLRQQVYMCDRVCFCHFLALPNTSSLTQCSYFVNYR